ncbi:hypothetical protein EC973_005830 [Apophysomyces ossiformis]|uniref:FAD-binding domain-containing protein n=1 Tax=Apophysomyces ossiformis TaxID=679940 RepID=A0A8H7BZ55_9FUNG|nr:hypothetical protein EC973_005830 [Apophysomyces ossiformis]
MDKAHSSGKKNPALLWSPRALQLLQTFDLANSLCQQGVRHWRFETFTNRGHGNSATNIDRQKFRVWENDATEFNWSLSCECDRVCQVLYDALTKENVKVHYGQEVIDLEDVDVNPRTAYPDQSPQHTRTTIHDTDTGQVTYWKSRIVIGADGIGSFVRQKLGLAQRSRKSFNTVYYTLIVSATTNFPGTKTLSTVSKGQDAIFIVGHRNKFYILFEHKPSWSRLTIDDDVPLCIAQRHIKSVLEPYQIEFGEVHAYYRWSADERACEEYSVGRRYFLVGSAAQYATPPGLLTAGLGLEQVQNLCWKLFLHLKQRASPEILDTYDSEAKSKLEALTAASQIFVQTFSPNDTQAVGLNSTYTLELQYQLKRNKRCFVGETPYHTNLLNLNASMVSFASSVDTVVDAKTLIQQQVNNPWRGTAGSLAQNAKLKPYTVFQLLMLQTQAKTEQAPPKSNQRSRRSWRPRSHSASSLSAGWSLALVGPILQNMTRRASTSARHQRHCSTSSQESSSFEGWRGIKPNHYQLLDRIHGDGSPVTFTILVFCGALTDDNFQRLRLLKRHLDDPQSFLNRYETMPYSVAGFMANSPRHAKHHPHRASLGSDITSTRSLSVSSASTTASHRSSTTSASSLSTKSIRFSLFSNYVPWRTSLDEEYKEKEEEDQIEEENPVFSFVYITSSTKADVSSLLASTPPSIIHATFPFGLNKVYLDHDQQSHTAYDIKSPTVVIVRPDGYIGARVRIREDELIQLDNYFDSFLRPPADMTSAAAVVAADFDC